LIYQRNIICPQYFFRHILSPMESLDQQLLQLKENYEHMTEDELCALAENAYDLTEIAREALQAVITERGFTVRLKLEPSAPVPAEPPEDDEGLINFQWPDNADHAWRWMKCLTAAGIPSFLGPDNVMHLEEFQGKFDGPVSLKIRDVDRDRALDAVARARARARANDGNEEKAPEEEKDNVDQQLRQLKENYRHMSEGQLCKLAENAYKLTDIAREALQAVITEKIIAVPLTLEPPHAVPLEDLVIFRWPKSYEEMGHTTKTLAAAGIPFFICLEVRADDEKRAHAAMLRAIDKEIEEDDPGEKKEYAILCPECRSAKVVLEGRDLKLADPPSRAKFQWRCDACGHRWVDDGITQEAAGGQSWTGEELPSRNKDSSGWHPKYYTE
jgi:DNA-directed RNA polymerase subunit M/transcription elongation factor TFIIS